MSDGLDSLDALAARAKRRTSPPPPPRRRVMAPQNPAPTSPVAAKQERAPGVSEVPEGQQQFPGLADQPPAPPEAVVEPATPPEVVAPARRVDLRKIAVYLDEDTDAALEAIRYAGASQRPRQDVSKSAVVRLALERLLGELSHNQVVAAIAARPTDQQGAGRKRR